MMIIFHQSLEKRSQLIEGRLLLVDNETIKDVYIATSGQPNYQSPESISMLGRGPLPSTIDLSGEGYKVITTPIPMPNLTGVNGNFYKINPHFVQIKNVQRGDFGIHFDANVPGSAGCVVIRNRAAWANFENEMKKLANSGVKEISLLVSYAR